MLRAGMSVEPTVNTKEVAVAERGQSRKPAPTAVGSAARKPPVVASN
jgi:hypothetical protein